MKATIIGMTVNVIRESRGLIHSMMATMPQRVTTSVMALTTPEVTSSEILSTSFVALETMPPTSRLA